MNKSAICLFPFVDGKMNENGTQFLCYFDDFWSQGGRNTNVSAIVVTSCFYLVRFFLSLGGMKNSRPRAFLFFRRCFVDGKKKRVEVYMHAFSSCYCFLDDIVWQAFLRSIMM